MRASMLPERGVHAIVPIIGSLTSGSRPEWRNLLGVHPHTNDSQQVVRNSVPNGHDFGASKKKKTATLGGIGAVLIRLAIVKCVRRQSVHAPLSARISERNPFEPPSSGASLYVLFVGPSRPMTGTIVRTVTFRFHGRSRPTTPQTNRSLPRLSG